MSFPSNAELFRAIFNSTFQFIGLLQPDGILLEANQTALDFGGLTPEDVIGRPFWECPWWTITPATQAELRAAITRAAQGEFVRYEVDVCGATGQIMTLDFSLKPLFDAAGNVTLLIPEGRDITDRKQAQSERNRIFELSRDLLAVAGLDGYFKRLNPAWEETLGYRREELLAIPFLELVHPDDQEVTQRELARLASGASTILFENRYRHSDGSYRWLAWLSDPLPEEGRLYCTARDITLQKQVEQVLRESEALLSSVLNSSLDGIAALKALRDAAGQIIDFVFILVNPKAEEILQRSAADLLGKRLLELMPTHHETGLFTAYKKVVETGQPGWQEVRYDGDGLQGWFQNIAVKLEDGFAVTFRDVTAQKAAEEMRLALAAAQMGTWEITLATEEVTRSNGTDQLFGYPPDGSRRTAADYIERVHPADQAQVEAAMRLSIEACVEHYVEYRVVRPDGSIRWVASRGNVLLDTQGQPMRLIGALTDITERKQAEEQVRAGEERLQRSLAELQIIYDTAPVGLCVLDTDLRFVRINQHLAEINGLPLEAHVGRTVHEIVPALAEQSEKFRARILETGDPVHNIEITGKTPAQPGRERCWIESWFPIRNEQGQIVYINIVTEEITARKEAEAAARTSEALYRAMAANLPSGAAFVVDHDLRYRLAGGQALNAAGLTSADFEGKTLHEAVDPELVRVHEPLYRQALAGTPVRLEHSSHGRHYVSHLVPLADQEGQVFAALAVSYDITERMQAEQSLRESEDRFRSTFENAAVGIAHVGFDGTWLRVNQRLCTIVGYTAEELAGQPFQDITHPDDLKIDLERFRLLMRGEVSGYQIEKRYFHKAGHIIWINLTTALQRDAVGTPRYCISVVEDITERKQAQEALKEAKEANERSLAQLEAVIQSIDQGLIIADTSGNILSMNRAALAIHEYASVEQVRRHLTEYPDTFVLHSLDGQPLPVEQWPLSRALSGENFSNYEVRVTRKDTDKIWVGSYGGTPVWDTNGEIILVVLTLRDVTMRKQAEEALQEAKEAAETANQMKSVFLANMSHEIRTPLTSMIGYASLLSRRLEGKTRSQAQRIEEGGKRLLETLNAVLMLAKLEAGRVEVAFETIHLAAEVREVVRLHQPQAEAKGLDMTVQVTPAATRARAALDRGALNSILQNLISNAIKFTETGSVTITVDCDKTPPSDIDLNEVVAPVGWVHVHVKDTGIGIAPAFLPHIFNAFHQESSGVSRLHDGIGLGLAIAHQLAEKMQGTITVVSEKGQGSRFTVSFPQVLAEEPEDQSGPAELVAGSQSPCHILLVEDNEDIRKLLETLLEDRCLLTAVTNAREAQEVVHDLMDTLEQTFDAVLLDVHLGGGPSGTDLLRILRELPAYRDVPIAALTAYALPGDRERFLHAGFDAYLRKPFTADELTAFTAQLLPR
ncbi:MAG: PAS domain S-box protein [Chloroflexaceae bacterium]